MIETESEDVQDVAINAKHRKIRGSSELKYPAFDSERCHVNCGLMDLRNIVATRVEDRRRNHRCFLFLGHEGDCEFSSECGASRFAKL